MYNRIRADHRSEKALLPLLNSVLNPSRDDKRHALGIRILFNNSQFPSPGLWNSNVSFSCEITVFDLLVL